jgi:hypothetical protein
MIETSQVNQTKPMTRLVLLILIKNLRDCNFVLANASLDFEKTCKVIKIKNQIAEKLGL